MVAAIKQKYIFNRGFSASKILKGWEGKVKVDGFREGTESPLPSPPLSSLARFTRKTLNKKSTLEHRYIPFSSPLSRIAGSGPLFPNSPKCPKQVFFSSLPFQSKTLDVSISKQPLSGSSSLKRNLALQQLVNKKTAELNAREYRK